MPSYDPTNPGATRLYHITDVPNLPSIIAGGALLSDALLGQQGGPASSIGYSHIKHTRMNVLRVGCCADRFVGEFVPFYFSPRSVMLYTVNAGRVANKPPGSQRNVVHLVTDVATVVAPGNPWAFSKRGANVDYPIPFWNDLTQLGLLDWDAIDATYWGEKGHLKSAEFLVADRVPWVAIRAIACFDAGVAAQVAQVLQGAAHVPTIAVKRGWYF